MNIPNILSAVRLLLVPVFLWCSLTGRYLAALGVFITAALTDVLDGYIARRLNQRTRLGAVLDPAADKALMVSGYLLFTLHDAIAFRIPGWLTFVVFIRDVLIVTFAYLAYTRVQVKGFPPTRAGKLSTVLQAVAIAATIAVNAGLEWSRPVEIFFRVTLLATLFSSWVYLRQGKRLVEEAAGEAG